MTGYQKLKAKYEDALKAIKEARDKLNASSLAIPVIKETAGFLDAALWDLRK